MDIESILRAKLGQTTIEDIVIPMNVYSALTSIQANGSNPGYSICAGFEESMANHVSMMDDDVFSGKNYNIKDAGYINYIVSAKASDGKDLDGAILIGKDGHIKHSGMYYDHSPKVTLQQMGLYGPKPMWKLFGFSQSVSSRHISAINGSYHMPTTFIFVLSEEHNTIRAFHRGKIIYSPVDAEMEDQI